MKINTVLGTIDSKDMGVTRSEGVDHSAGDTFPHLREVCTAAAAQNSSSLPLEILLEIPPGLFSWKVISQDC